MPSDTRRGRALGNGRRTSAFMIINDDIDNPELCGEYQAGAIPALA